MGILAQWALQRIVTRRDIYVVTTIGVAYLTLCVIRVRNYTPQKPMLRAVVHTGNLSRTRDRNVKENKAQDGLKHQMDPAVAIGDIDIGTIANCSNVTRQMKYTIRCDSTNNETAEKKAKCSSNPPWCCPSCLRGGQERSVMSAMVDGYVFHPGGIAVRPHMITTALVHDFSNFIEAEAYKRTLDRFHHVNYCVISPAMEEIESGYLTAFRLYRCPHKNTRKMHHEFLTDLVFVQKYDKDLRPHGPGYFLSFAYHRFEGMELWDGPQDPRAFKVNSSVYLLFHAAVYRHQNGTEALLEPIIWDLEKNLPGIPDLRDNPLTHNNPLMFIHDKNWMPLVHNDQLFLVQLLDPTLVISCTLDAVCKYSQNVSSARNPFARYFTLRGGSQFQLWQYPYYIGAAHSRSFSTRGSITYGEIAAHLVLISVHNFRFVFVTDFLHLNNSIFKRSKLKHLPFYESAFFFPVSLVVESKDSILVGGHINDDRSVLVRIRGIKYMMEDAIKRDQSLNPEALKPKRRVVQRFFRRLYAQKRRARRLKP